MPAILRYPGSKAKLLPQIEGFLPDCLRGGLYPCTDGFTYVDAFAGSGASFLRFTQNASPNVTLWVNDIDYSIHALWKCVLNNPDKLCELVWNVVPSAELFYELKKKDGVDTGDILQDAVDKIALHRMSVSGFGAKAGGPIGGRRQLGEYTVGCRWRPASIEVAIRSAHELMKRFKYVSITNLHFSEVLNDCGIDHFLYLDPPYYVKGNDLYRNGMTHQEHVALARSLVDTPANWVLSYDDCDEVRNLYKQFPIRELEVRYTNAVQRGGKRPKNKELLIFSEGLEDD